MNKSGQEQANPSEWRVIIRMFVVQAIQSRIVARKKMSNWLKVFCLFLIFAGMLGFDYYSHLQKRQKNMYEGLGIPKNATNDQINIACNDLIEQLEAPDYVHKVNIFTKDNIEDIRHALTSTILKDIYNKHGILVSREELKEKGGSLPQSYRYFQAFGNSMQFSVFLILIFLMIDKHQVFAKQLTLSSLLVFLYISVYMKFPKDGDSDNEIVELINRQSFFDNITIHEVGQLLFMVFQNLFHFILSLSKLVDVHPFQELKDNIKKFQKRSYYSQLMCELLAPARPPKEEEVPVMEVEEAKGEDNIVEKPVVPELSEAEKKKQEFFDAFTFVSELRQKNFLKAFNSLTNKKKQDAKNESKMKKCLRILGKLAVWGIILTIVAPMIYGIYIQVTGKVDESKIKTPQSPFGKNDTAFQEYTKEEEERFRQQQKDDEYEYQEKEEDLNPHHEEPKVDIDEIIGNNSHEEEEVEEEEVEEEKKSQE